MHLIISFVLLCGSYFSLLPQARAETQIEVELNIPKITAEPYFKPYVAVWLETQDREPVATLALWYMQGKANKTQEDGTKWLKDLRQWWRKIGSTSAITYDVVTGPTRRPASYRVQWSSSAIKNEHSNNNLLVLHIEAAREEGGRSYLRLPLNTDKEQTERIKADGELGIINVKVTNHD